MNPLFKLSANDFPRRDTAPPRMDVRLKMGIAAALFAAVLSSTKPVLPLSVALWCLSMMIVLRVPLKVILRRLLPPLGIVFVIGGMQAFLMGKTPVFSVFLGHTCLTVTAEGIAKGALTGSRVLGAIGVLLLLDSLTPAHELFRGLRWCRMPKVWIEIALLVYRYIFVLIDEAADMARAQRARLGYCGFRNALSSVGSLMGAVIVRSVTQSFRTHEAMITRGYTGEYPFEPMSRLSRQDWFGMLGAAAAIGSLFVLMETWPS